jgi:hypothetical protein
MSSTKKILSDAVLLRIAGGFPDVAESVDERDLFKAIEQKINAKLKMEHYQETLPSGETIPQGVFLATYTSVAVTSAANGMKSKCTLPAIPVSLPRSIGIAEVYDPLHPDRKFIPLQAAQMSLLNSDDLLSSLMGQIGYTPYGKTLEFTKDLTTLGVDAVDMRLMVFDMSEYDLTDVLPIPASMEEEIINELVVQFTEGSAPPESGLVNNFTNAQNQAK